MIRQIAPTSLALLAAALAAPVPAMAAPVHYRAELATAVPQPRLVARDLVWSCEGSTCVAARSHSRPAIVCALLAREAGPMRSFSAGGESMSPEALEKCNSRAR